MLRVREEGPDTALDSFWLLNHKSEVKYMQCSQEEKPYLIVGSMTSCVRAVLALFCFSLFLFRTVGRLSTRWPVSYASSESHTSAGKRRPDSSLNTNFAVCMHFTRDANTYVYIFRLAYIWQCDVCLIINSGLRIARLERFLRHMFMEPAEMLEIETRHSVDIFEGLGVHRRKLEE